MNNGNGLPTLMQMCLRANIYSVILCKIFHTGRRIGNREFTGFILLAEEYIATA